MYPEIEIFSFYLPSPVFTDEMFIFRQISCISPPIIRIIKVNGDGLKIVKQLSSIGIGSVTIMPGQNDARCFVHGIPCPSLIGFAADKGPKFVHFGRITDGDFQLL